MNKHSYMHLGEPKDPDHNVICKYKVTTGIPIERAAEAIAAEQSTGTWTDISTINNNIIDRFGARVIDISGDIVTIQFPEDDFSIDIGSIPQMLSIISGNLFGLDILSGIRLEDVFFTKSIMSRFKGPKFGVEGIRRILNRPKKPLVGTIIKPKIGLSPNEIGKYVYEAGVGGATNSKDDETLVNQNFCPIQSRTFAIAEALDRLSDEGHNMIHAINVSTRGDKIIELAEKVQGWGARQIMVDVITCGFGAVQALSEDPSIKIPIHVHRTMHGAFTKNPYHGISMLPLTKLVRMCGGDALHIGTLGIGKMSSDMQDSSSLMACLNNGTPHKAMIPVCSGGVHPGIVGKIIRRTGFDVQIQAGGGIAGHPNGIMAGTIAMCQAVDAAFNDIPVQKYAETHKELSVAINKWGFK